MKRRDRTLCPVVIALVAAWGLAPTTPVAEAQPAKPAAKPVRKRPAPRPVTPPEPAARPAEAESGAPAPPPAPAASDRAAAGRTETAEAPGDRGPRPDGAGAAPAGATAVDLGALRTEYQTLKDALFRSRARRETLETALLSTQLTAIVTWDGGRRHNLKRVEVRLDGVRMWESSEGATWDRPVALAARSAPPGPHVLGVRVEVRARDKPDLGYVSEQSFAVSLPEGKKTTIEIAVDEGGSPPSYNPDIEIDVESK